MRRAAIACLVLACIAPLTAWSEEVGSSHREAAAELLRITASRAAIEAWIERSVPWERMEPRMIDLYVKELSEEEIRELIAFYRTPVGRKLAEKLPILAGETREIGMELASKPTPRQETPLERGNRLYDEERWAEARDAYIQHLERNPDDPDVRSDLGVCYQELGAYPEAIREFDRVLASHPEHWQALYNKIVVLAFSLGKKAEARALLPRLRALSSDEAVQKLAAAVEGE